MPVDSVREVVLVTPCWADGTKMRLRVSNADGSWAEASSSVAVAGQVVTASLVVDTICSAVQVLPHWILSAFAQAVLFHVFVQIVIDRYWSSTLLVVGQGQKSLSLSFLMVQVVVDTTSAMAPMSTCLQELRLIAGDATAIPKIPLTAFDTTQLNQKALAQAMMLCLLELGLFTNCSWYGLALR
jgi:hypothetical protein